MSITTFACVILCSTIKLELSRPDVIIAHRVMKNEVKEKTGYKAYTLFSESAVNALDLQDFTCEMKPHSETYDHVGEVRSSIGSPLNTAPITLPGCR
ncbi:MAG: hypothetical protein HXY40_06630 [Chloroflexi bacterium]|nr:hypothetical protein [Chloroflexota bacterium]